MRDIVLQNTKQILERLTTERGLKQRPSQNMMIAGITDMLIQRMESPDVEKGSNLLAVEAPTGTGKSFGYLIPTIAVAKAAQKKVIVSTAVVSLQEQLISKDLPAIAKASAVPFTFAIAKGRSRFVCPSRLRSKALEATEEGVSLTDDKNQKEFTITGGPKEEEFKEYLKLQKLFEQKKWSGEQETLPAMTEDTRKVLWAKVTTDNSGCTGKSCKDYKACPYYEARKTWQNADVIVANHDLVMSDLHIGSSSPLLAPPEESIFVFDEAHHLPQKARDTWSRNFRTDTFPKIFKEIPINLNDTAMKWHDSGCKYADGLATKMDAWKTKSQVVGKQLDSLQKEFDKVLLGMTKNLAPKEPFVLSYTDTFEDLMDIVDRYGSTAKDLQSITSALINDVNKQRFELIKNGASPASPLLEDAEMNRVLGAFGFYNNRLLNLYETLSLFGKEQPDPSKPPLAKWIVPDDKHKSFQVHATPTMATDILPTYLYNKAWAVVHASATITSIGNFNLFKQKTGLCYYPNARMLKLESPFDFEKNASLVLGDMGVSPGDAAAHTRRLTEVLPVLFTEKQDLGTLVLFSSKSQLEQVYQGLPMEFKQYCKVQYHAPNQNLIEAHKKDVDQGKRSILMGTQSFSEGLDLPGAWCSHVVSTKLPFSMPDNPIDKTLTAWMESQGRNVFKEIAVPEASERLIQQAGRLLRTEEDTGQFTLLDNRIVSKWNTYGKLLVEALPPLRRARIDLKNKVYKSSSPKVAVAPAPVVKAPAKGLPELNDYDSTTWEIVEPF